MRTLLARIVAIGAAAALATSSVTAAAQTQPAAGPEAGAPSPGNAPPTDTGRSPYNRTALINIGILAALTAIVLVATTTGHKKNGGSPVSP